MHSNKWNDYVEIGTMKKLFVVPLAENNSGKSRIIRSLVKLGRGDSTGFKRNRMVLTTFGGQRLSALIFPSSLPEMRIREPQLSSSEEYLKTLDTEWWTYDLIIMPSHETLADVREMIAIGKQHGYNMVAATVTLNERSLSKTHKACLAERWDERWVVRNPKMRGFCKNPKEKLSELTAKGQSQIDHLAGQLWTRIHRTMIP